MERGRPRQFDEREALEAAMQVFWRDGYRGASMAELTAAMGINKPSLYATFGSKEALYLKALEHYGATQSAGQAEALNGDLPIRETVAAFLRAVVQSGCDKTKPGGCYVVNALADCGATATPELVAEATQAAFQASQAALKERLLRARSAGELSAEADATALANFYCSVLTGMALMARNGSSKSALNAVVEQALAALPLADRK